MPKVNVYNMQGEQVEQIELNEATFGVEVSQHAAYQVVKNQLANKRQGTQSTKTRAEVRGGGRKPWRQKGTGRARQGSIRAPHWTGGGVVFAPKPRDYSYKTPKKIKRLAMKSALTSKVEENEIIVIDEFKIDSPKTKDMVNILNKLSADKKALIVTLNPETNVIKSANNLPGVQTTIVSNLNVYELLKYNSLIITKEAVRKVEEVYA
ncbi:MAG: 50S ribosomal protein L4 [Tissierella sp.]|uniref:50S ribosomal protein L4 n=1 Tax=Tissierella sp. TaxID=41274 RepID=UPI003F9562BB